MGPSGPSLEQETMWLLGNDSPCASWGLITIKSRFMTLLSHPVNELAGLESEGFPWMELCVRTAARGNEISWFFILKM